MLINELGRSIQADRQREIEERLRQRGMLEDAEYQARDATVGARGPSKDRRPVGVRSSGMPAHGRPR